MALKQNSTPTANAAFESEEGLEQAAPATSTVAAVAVAATRTLAAAAPRAGAAAVMSQNVLSGLKNAFTVEFDSLPGIAANQGSFAFKDTEQELGAEIQIQLMSFQDSWVASPNDTKADIELVKYSTDGVTSKDGVNLLAHVEDLKEQGYSKAKITHRCVLVGELLTVSPSAGDVDRIGELVQIDMPESGRRAFNTYTLQASYAVAKGRKSAEEASTLTLKAVKETTKAGEKYTKITIS